MIEWDYEDDDQGYGDDDPRELPEFGCCLPPGECCMPGLHFESECHTAADYEGLRRPAGIAVPTCLEDGVKVETAGAEPD